MLVSQMEMDVSPPYAGVIALVAFEKLSLGVDGIDVILQFTLFGESRLAMTACLLRNCRRLSFLRLLLLLEPLERIFSHLLLQNVFRGHRDAVLASQMEMDVSPPDADEVAVLALEIFGLGMHGVDVILQFALLGERRIAMIAAFHFGRSWFLAFHRFDRILGHLHDADMAQRH